MEVRRESAVCVFGDTVLNIYIKIRLKAMSLMCIPSSTKYISRFRGKHWIALCSEGEVSVNQLNTLAGGVAPWLFAGLCSPSCLRLLFSWGYASLLWKLHCLFRDLTILCEEGKPIAYAWSVFRLESSNSLCLFPCQGLRTALLSIFICLLNCEYMAAMGNLFLVNPLMSPSYTWIRTEKVTSIVSCWKN